MIFKKNSCGYQKKKVHRFLSANVLHVLDITVGAFNIHDIAEIPTVFTEFE